MFSHDVINLYVFDKNDKKVAEFEVLKKGSFEFSEKDDRKGYTLTITDTAYNIDFIKFASGQDIENVTNYTDYELYLGKRNTTETVEIGVTTVECKLLAKTYLVDEHGRPTKEVIYEIPNAETPLINFEHLCNELSTFKLTFNINSYSKYGDKFFKLHIKDK